MNTVEKGNYFEDISYALIKQKVENLEFGVIPSQTCVYQKRKYYSRYREANIEFDISIEVKLPSSNDYFLLYLIECKNYSKNVPVDDMEEFYSKVSQVSGANVKAVFITSSGYSKGARTFAKSKGIMIVEVNANLTFNIILHKTANRKNTKEDYIPKKKMDIEVAADKAILNLWFQKQIERNIIYVFIDYLKQTGQIENGDFPRLSGTDIDLMVLELLSEIDPEFVSCRERLNIDNLVSYLENTLNFKLSYMNQNSIDVEGRTIIAKVDFSTRELSIASDLKGTHRFAFVFAHEFGHICLHNKLVISQNTYESFQDHKHSFRLGKGKFTNERQWIEWQANRFAASLLMPTNVFQSVVKATFKLHGRRTNQALYVDDNNYSQKDFHNIVNSLATYFRTTKTSIIYRMHEFELINDNTRTKHVSEILKMEYPSMYD